MDKVNTPTHKVVCISGDKIDRIKWDRCIDNAINGNICNYSWFLDILCCGWNGLVVGDYEFVMPIPVASRFGISYLLQPRFIQQSGVFGKQLPDTDIIRFFVEALPKNISVVDYHFNHQNILPSSCSVEMRNNLVLKLDKSYEELKGAYSQNLIRNLKKSLHSGFHIIKNENPELLIQMFRDEKGEGLSFLKDNHYLQLARVIHACLHRGKADVWSVYNRDNELCGGVTWLYSHDKAVLYFTAQSKTGRTQSALAWLIDAFIREHASSGMMLDFEGSVQPGLARFYSGYGAVLQLYPGLRINDLSPFLKLAYTFYRKMKKG